jgi:hypothetical protein
VPQTPNDVAVDISDLTEEEACLFANKWYLGLCDELMQASTYLHGEERTGDVFNAILTLHAKQHFFTNASALGIDDSSLTDAQKCGRYHFTSNWIGGWRVQYLEETPDRTWIRYMSCTWCSCAPSYCSTGMAGWHGKEAGFLGNPNLGFTATKSIGQGDPYCEGFWEEGDEPREEFAKRSARSPAWPAFDDESPFPWDEDAWPSVRRHKARRNYARMWFARFVEGLCDEYGERFAQDVIRYAATKYAAKRAIPGPESITLLGQGGVADARLPTLTESGYSMLDIAKILAKISLCTGERVELEAEDDTVTLRHHDRVFEDIDPPFSPTFAVWDAILSVRDAVAKVFDPQLAWQLTSIDDGVVEGRLLRA